MRGKKYLVASIVIGTTLVCSACGSSLPDLTEEEYNQTIEYAAGILMKHSNNEQERLVYVDPEAVEKERERKAEREAIREANLKELQEKQNAAMEEEQRLEEEQQAEQEREDESAVDESSLDNSGNIEDEATQATSKDSEDESSTMEANTKDTTGSEETSETEENNTSNSSKDSGSSSSAVTVTSDDSQELQSNIFISYDGYSISSHYPESSKSYVINADKGRKLLVLRFDLYNAASSAQQVNMYSKGLTFQVSVNGKKLGYTSVTVLPNDLSTYLGSVDSKAHESLVLLMQIDEDTATSIKTIEMTVTMNGKEQTVNLK
ncbi:hypothetical protein [Butyrivibrio proteoclasticus]|uniref:hypothetical protein n=1 Tax=Butyrivibrio proteoclasticus TaxID=43305 RepID=UPI00047BE7A2|nr:hypothetical protein [Butyrivibrio proteoclasticus]